MTDRLMTYEELAAFLGRTPEAARQLAKRKRWRRVTGNDGRARVSVPVEEIEVDRMDDRRTTTPPSDRQPPGRPPADRPDVAGILINHISRLESELEVERQRIEALERDRDAAMTRASDRDVLAAQLEALRAVLEVERQRAEEQRQRVEAVEKDRAAWQEQAQRLALAPPAAAPAQTVEAPRRRWWRFG